MDIATLRRKGFIFKPTKWGWVVVNKKGKKENHSHFTAYTEAQREDCKINCIICAKLTYRKQIPKSEYMMIACHRLTTDKDYKELLRIEIDRVKSSDAK